MFESSVNSEYSKTPSYYDRLYDMFESSVNSEYSKTFSSKQYIRFLFESSVNSDVKFNNRNINFPAKSFFLPFFIYFFTTLISDI